MALVPDSTSLSLSVNSTLAKATRAVAGFLSPQPHSPEYDLLNGTLRDARLAPRVPMSGAELDTGLLAQLSSIGLKRGKQVTDASHPELMRAWKAMSARAGLATPPQLIIAESASLNALTVTPSEVVITTGLLKVLDLRETVAVLGHELGHVSSDHIKPRLLWMGALGGLGAVAGNEFGRAGGANMLLHKIGSKLPFAETIRGWMYPKTYVKAASSAIGYLGYMGVAAGVGGMLARNISVHPTELDADQKGAAISGDPLALASALNALQTHSPRSNFMAKVARWQAGYPSMEKRIDRLQQLQMPPQASVMAQIEANSEQPAPSPQEKSPRFAVNNVASAERMGELASPAIT